MATAVTAASSLPKRDLESLSSNPINESFRSINTDAETSNHVLLQEEQERQNKLVIAQRETHFMRCLRIVVVLILILAAAGSATAVYLYTSSSQNQDFTQVYDQYAKLIVDTVQINAQHKLEAIGAIAAVVQGHALSSNSTWPFVTVPFFEEHIMATKSLTDAYGVVLFPIVSDDNRAAWETYSLQEQGWIEGSYKTQRVYYGEDQAIYPEPNQTWWDVLWGDDFLDPNNPDCSSGIGVPIFRTRPLDNPDTTIPVIEQPDNPGGPYFPQWQAASMSWYYQSTVNSNYGQFDDFLESTRLATANGQAVFGMPWTDDNVPGYITTMLFPIFDTFVLENRKVVGFLAVDVFWEAYISRILPQKASGIHVVVESTFGDVFTFELVGEKAIFMGDGDLHETAFNDMAVSTRIGQYLQEPIDANLTTYTGAPLYNGFYQYNFTVYPSAELKSQYVTSEPVGYMVGVLCAFAFTSLVFVAYDCIAERRQRIVMQSAVRSDAIVSSLFPSSVKEKLYEQKDEEERTERGDRTNRTDDDRLTNIMGIANPNMKDAGPPIAELYPSATVLFADLAGFTAWSSKHSPVEVFTLLETIYGSFDKLAKRRGVFKIETIGDCYVAVTGLPTPREDHAVAMARFARDMMDAWDEEKMILLSVLGADMFELGLRVGMHSGPVTAGVLRGDRARFQLFGDTVNTASRMESNGRPMRIHLSEDTANLLRKGKKEYWIKLREDKIVAKGKGEMQTYWLEANTDKTATFHDSMSSHMFHCNLELGEEFKDMERQLRERLEV